MINYIEVETIVDLNNNPFFKELLKKYCLIHYEADAVMDDNHLIMEYNYLNRTNRLHELFECEMLSNYFEE